MLSFPLNIKQQTRHQGQFGKITKKLTRRVPKNQRLSFFSGQEGTTKLALQIN